MEKQISYKLVDTAGQITAVVLGEIKRIDRARVSNRLMGNDPKIEQVVFASRNKIQTMGNELCINGSLAGAYLLDKKYVLISGVNKFVKFQKQMSAESIRFPLNILKMKRKNIILFNGIVYIISNNNQVFNKEFLKNLTAKYKVPASGAVSFRGNKIKPLIYVMATNSLIWENACGSGSLAYSIYSGCSKILQPSGQIISITKNKISFTIKVPVKIVE